VRYFFFLLPQGFKDEGFGFCLFDYRLSRLSFLPGGPLCSAGPRFTSNRPSWVVSFYPTRFGFLWSPSPRGAAAWSSFSLRKLFEPGQLLKWRISRVISWVTGTAVFYSPWSIAASTNYFLKGCMFLQIFLLFRDDWSVCSLAILCVCIWKFFFCLVMTGVFVVLPFWSSKEKALWLTTRALE
jgi:hypothetical protein